MMQADNSVQLLVPTLLYLLGLALVVVELFIPSGGIISIAALLCLGYSIYQIFQLSSLLGFLVVLLTSGYVVWVVRWGLRRLTLSSGVEGSASGRDVSEARERVGQVGRAVTPLRPAGVAMFADRRLDVVTGGAFIEAGGHVEIVSADGNRIVVKGVTSGDAE